MGKYITKIVDKFKSKDFYIGFLFRLLSVSFVLLLWLYLKSLGAIEMESNRIVLYFIMVAVFQYLFFYDFATDFLEIIDNEWEEAQLLPGGVINFTLRKSFYPKLTEALILGCVVMLIGVGTGVLDLQQSLSMVIALLIGNLYYVFFSITMVILGRYINWTEYMGFTLRFIGFTWNGSYIPYIFIFGVLGNVFTYTPFFPSGLFLQPIWDSRFDISHYFVIVIVGAIGWLVASLIMLRSYLLVRKIQ